MSKAKKGILFGLLSGLSWGFYTVFLFNVINPFNASQGEVGSFQGILLIIVTACIIAFVDSCIAWIFELVYLAKKGKLKEYFRILLSKDSLGIIPAVLFSGLLGAVPYAIASSYSTSVAGTISAAFPVIGALVAVVWFKEKLTKLKFAGIVICIVGTGIIYGLSGGDVPFYVYLIALVCAVGYAFEGLFGYRMIRGDMDSSVTTTLRRIYLIAILFIVIAAIVLFTGTLDYAFALVAGFEVNNTVFAFLAPYVSNELFIWGFFALGSLCGAISYIVWYYSMEYGGVATAQVLNITYGIWVIVLLALPPFNQVPTVGMILGAAILFIGAAIVVRESNKAEDDGAHEAKTVDDATTI